MSGAGYTLKGNGWEIEVDPFNACTVRQLSPGVPIAVRGSKVDDVLDWVLVYCLRCGEQIFVKNGIAPVCNGCRD